LQIFVYFDGTKLVFLMILFIYFFYIYLFIYLLFINILLIYIFTIQNFMKNYTKPKKNPSSYEVIHHSLHFE